MVKLGDFGLAVQLEHSYSVRKADCGTPLYVAPEVYDGQGCLKSDVWSLGMSIIVMADGKHPFYGYSTLQVLKLWKCDQ